MRKLSSSNLTASTPSFSGGVVGKYAALVVAVLFVALISWRVWYWQQDHLIDLVPEDAIAYIHYRQSAWPTETGMPVPPLEKVHSDVATSIGLTRDELVNEILPNVSQASFVLITETPTATPVWIAFFELKQPWLNHYYIDSTTTVKNILSQKKYALLPDNVIAMSSSPLALEKISADTKSIQRVIDVRRFPRGTVSVFVSRNSSRSVLANDFNTSILNALLQNDLYASMSATFRGWKFAVRQQHAIFKQYALKPISNNAVFAITGVNIFSATQILGQHTSAANQLVATIQTIGKGMYGAEWQKKVIDLFSQPIDVEIALLPNSEKLFTTLSLDIPPLMQQDDIEQIIQTVLVGIFPATNEYRLADKTVVQEFVADPGSLSWTTAIHDGVEYRIAAIVDSELSIGYRIDSNRLTIINPVLVPNNLDDIPGLKCGKHRLVGYIDLDYLAQKINWFSYLPSGVIGLTKSGWFINGCIL